MLTKTLTFSATALAVALALSACGGGGGSSASAGSTTVGTITGFGSVFVNGVEFETAGANISVDEADAAESNLKVGMVVTVQGQVNPDGSTGTATSIQFSDELEGQVISNSIIAPDTTGVIDIMGQQITITGTTVFESDVTGITTIDQIVAGNIVEVSGTVTGPGSIEATRIEVKAATRIDRNDARGLGAFRKSYPHLNIAPGLIVAPIERPFRLAEDTFAVPWDASVPDAGRN